MNKRGIKIMAIAKMGKLVEVDIRKLWEHEQYDFLNGFQIKKIWNYLMMPLGFH